MVPIARTDLIVCIRFLVVSQSARNRMVMFMNGERTVSDAFDHGLRNYCLMGLLLSSNVASFNKELAQLVGMSPPEKRFVWPEFEKEMVVRRTPQSRLPFRDGVGIGFLASGES